MLPVVGNYPSWAHAFIIPATETLPSNQNPEWACSFLTDVETETRRERPKNTQTEK